MRVLTVCLSEFNKQIVSVKSMILNILALNLGQVNIVYMC